MYNTVFALLGADYQLMLACGARQAIARYTYAAIALAAIGLLIFCSVCYAMYVLFDSMIIEGFLAFYLSALFLLMYVLLLNTFTKTSLSSQRFFTLSNISRGFFLLFMAFIISKPLEVCLLAHYHHAAVDRHRADLTASFARQVAGIYRPDLQLLERKMAVAQQQHQLYPDTNSAAALQSLANNISAIAQRQAKAVSSAAVTIDQSFFMLKRMELASGNMIAWLICLAVMCLFLLPGYLVYSLPGNDPYLVAKGGKERACIEREFDRFLQEYHRVFSARGLTHVKYSTPFADPPFNTIRKQQKTYADNNSFLDKYGPL